MSTRKARLFRTAVAAASAAAVSIVPSLVAVSNAGAKEAGRGVAVRSAALRAPDAEHESLSVLRAPAPPPTTHPKVGRGYVAPKPPSKAKASKGFAAAAASSTFAAAATPASARTWGIPGSSVKTLVVYDTTDAFGWLGELYGMAAGNLASHFGEITAEPVVDYQAGQLNDFTAVIYIGSTYNEPIPVAFLNDVLATTKQVVWAGDNVWQLAGTPAAATAFQAAYGWDASTSYFDDTDTITQVLYNGQTLTRNAGAGSMLAPHITSTTGQVTVLGQVQCGTVTAPVASASIAQAPPGSTTFPWAIKSANLTYIGEIPLTFMNETDRYLAFSDLLFSVLSPTAPTVRQAMVRLEDVSPGIDTPEQLTAIADYLSSKNVPFSVGVIPAYADPNGFYNGGVPETMDISQTSNPTIAAFNDALRYMVSKGGTLIEHGNTHQYSNIPNPYTGVSGDDFEFYRSECSSTQNPPYSFHSPCIDSDWIIQEGPLATDSAAFAQSRVAAGKALFAPAGLPTPTIWETPHYSASAVDYKAFNSVYPIRYEREQFFGGELSGVTPNPPRVFGQFYPYVVRDVYGTTVIPESLANYEPDAVNHTAARLPAQIIANAQAELAVRQGVASFFFHPYYDLSALQQIVEGIQGLGYTFVSPATLLAQSVPATPAITSVAPNSGPIAGGTSVTITGTGLAGASAVTFGGTAGAIVSNTGTQIVATSPAHAAGAVDVRATTPGGISPVVAADQFTYVAPAAPAVTAVSPNSGPIAGGTSVTITGTGLGGASAVTFGGSAAAIVSNTDTQIVATSPAHAAGLVDVQVTNTNGTSAVVAADGFTYVAPAGPAVTAVSPTSGPIAGGTSVTITGTNLAGATDVSFGTTPAVIVSNTATQIVATAPAHSAGLVDVRVTNANGTSAVANGDRYTYVAPSPPAVTSVSPNNGSTGGGTSVTITGTNMAGATAVAFGTTAATIVSNTATQVVVTSPAHSAGLVDVRVTTGAGTSSTVTADRYTYVTPARPAITSVSPNSGPTTGGTTVTITGTTFTGATSVAFGTTAATIVSNTATQIVVTSPAHSAGLVDVRVTTAGGTSNTVTADRFNYVTPATVPTVTSVSPNSGGTNGGTRVTITGTGLSTVTTVRFGTKTTSIISKSATQIVANSPSNVPGTVDVTVTSPTGTSAVVAGDKFTYKGSSSTSLATSSTSPSRGQAVTFTATVKSNSGGTLVPTGTVRFTDNGGTISACSNVALNSTGKATCTVAFSSRGFHLILANYNGNSFYNTSTGLQLISVR